jgi:hypothetical protein
MPSIVIIAGIGSIAATALLTWALWRMNKPEPQRVKAPAGEGAALVADSGGSTRSKHSDSGDGDGGGDGGGGD